MGIHPGDECEASLETFLLASASQLMSDLMPPRRSRGDGKTTDGDHTSPPAPCLLRALSHMGGATWGLFPTFSADLFPHPASLAYALISQAS